MLIRKFSEAEDAEALFKELLGIKFRLGKISTVLPSVFEDEKVTPDPYTVEIVQKPAVRPARTPVLHFKLLEAEKREMAAALQEARDEKENFKGEVSAQNSEALKKIESLKSTIQDILQIAMRDNRPTSDVANDMALQRIEGA